VKIAPGSPLEVSLCWGAGDTQHVGRLAYRDQLAYLEYTPEFLASGTELSPIRHRLSMKLEPAYQPHPFEGLHGVFNDSLPDGWGRLLVDRRAQQLGIEPATLTPLDRLACVGSNGIGALVYAPASDVWETSSQDLDLTELAADARQVLEGDVSEVISILGQAGGSPGGARPKALIGVDGHGHAVHGENDLPDGYAHYLVKFPGHGDPEDIAAIEMAYADMATEAGVTMPTTKLLQGDSGANYFATQRFDRDGSNRLHVHSASGLLYADIRIPSLDYKDLIALTRAVTRDHREVRKMYELAVFNVLAHNRDDHAKQFSFVMSRDGTWRLAPAYDLTWSQGPGGEHSTSLLGLGKDISREALLKLGAVADLSPKVADQIIEITTAAVSKWVQFAERRGVGRKSKEEVRDAIGRVRV